MRLWTKLMLLIIESSGISQINPTSCTIHFNIFIYFSSLHVSGIHVPIIRRKLLYPCDIGICHSAWVASGLLVGLKIQPADQTPPMQIDKYQCHMDTVIFLLMMGTWENYCVWFAGWIFNRTSRPDATHADWQIPVSHGYSNFLPMMGTWMSETFREEIYINILKGIVHLVGFICEIIQGCTVNKT